jgi:hypothetical protein
LFSGPNSLRFDIKVEFVLKLMEKVRRLTLGICVA